jgi:chitin disaccharide deacetylase
MRPIPGSSQATLQPTHADTALPEVKGLIVCADDFAASENVSAAIAVLAGQGRITATSAMVLSPRWPKDALLLADLRGRIDVGLHLDWTSEFACRACHGMSLAAAMIKSIAGGFRQADAALVIERQLDEFETHWHAAPDHVDGHQHVQQFAGIREALIETLARRYPKRKPWLRISRVPTGQADVKSRIIAAMGATALLNLADRSGFATSNALSGVYDFSGTEERYARLMSHWLQTSPAGATIMCHPARNADRSDPIAAARIGEFAYLTGERFPAALKRWNVGLVRGDAL